jgi:hypothetical protein
MENSIDEKLLQLEARRYRLDFTYKSKNHQLLNLRDIHGRTFKRAKKIPTA